MRYRNFGKAGWQVSEIGFGAMHLAGMEEREAVKLLLTAFERGINFVDTAAAYGVSEENVGKALREWGGNDIYIATKLKPVEWPLPSEPDPSFVDRYPAAYIRSECEASLHRLGKDTIDLYQLHGWFPRGLEETEWYETLQELVQQGKIRQIGVSLRDYRPEEGLAVARSGRIASEQVVFNLFEQRPADELFPVCRENGVAVIARVPFDEGALTGAWDAGTYDRFDPNDFRRTYFKGNRFMVTLEKVERIKRTLREAVGNGRFPSLAEVALRLCLSDSRVSCVIPGMSRMSDLEANLKAADGEGLPEELQRKLQEFNWPRNFWNPDVEVDPA